MKCVNITIRMSRSGAHFEALVAEFDLIAILHEVVSLATRMSRQYRLH